MIQGIQDIELSGKRVFIRVDYNVPLDSQGNIVDDSRIQASLPTIKYALEQGAKLILASHLGRPKGRPNPRLSLLPVAQRLSELLDHEVIFPENCIGPAVKKLVSELKEGGLILLENLRFHAEETANERHFSQILAQNIEVYINDAFGTLHRAHASTVGMVEFVPERGAGYLVQKEVQCLEQLLDEPRRPFMAILGGAKVSDKLGVLENLVKKVDALLIGGAMAYTFLKAQGFSLGNSLIEAGKVRQAAKILERAQLRDVPVILPVDHVIGRELSGSSEYQTTKGADIPSDWMGLDIGPKSLEKFGDTLSQAQCVLWNGPLGAFEVPPFNQGTLGIARKVAQLDAYTVVGGGDSVAAIRQAQVEDKISHLSTGGGATLEFLEGKRLPGLAALEKEV